MFIKKKDYEANTFALKEAVSRYEKITAILKEMTRNDSKLIYSFCNWPNGVFFPTKVYSEVSKEMVELKRENLELRERLELYRTEYRKLLSERSFDSDNERRIENGKLLDAQRAED